MKYKSRKNRECQFLRRIFGPRDNVKMVLLEWEEVERIYLARDNVQWGGRVAQSV
jgi:hypothetical protein